VDGRVYAIGELTVGFLVTLVEPNGVQTRHAALTVAQVVAIIKGFGLDMFEQDTAH
jgi:hypothetical protein